MLLVLVGLEDDSGECCIALYALRSTDTSVFGTEPALEEVVHIILNTGRRLCRIIIQIVNMNIAQLVCFCKSFG